MSEDLQAHDVRSNLQPQPRHVLLVKVKCRAPGDVLGVLQGEHAAVAAIRLVGDVRGEPAHTQRSTLRASASAATAAQAVQVAADVDLQRTRLPDDVGSALGQRQDQTLHMLQASQPDAICFSYEDTGRIQYRGHDCQAVNALKLML